MLIILNVTGTSDFKATQWSAIPNGDLTMNLQVDHLVDMVIMLLELHFHVFINF